MDNSNSLNHLDKSMRAMWARVWGSLSPESQLLAWLDWSLHLSISPGKRIELLELYLKNAEQCFQSIKKVSTPMAVKKELDPSPDYRFKDPAWEKFPFNIYKQNFLAQEQWWQTATEGIKGVEPHHEKLVSFSAKQWLDMFSPGNFLFTNPEILSKTLQEGGANLKRGMGYLMEDMRTQLNHEPPIGTENFRVGHEVAITPGKVVYRNELIELIQYSPTTDKVHPEPILIVPAWIMKYYILDLSPHNSLVKYLVAQGYTVFMISWKNPDEKDKDLDMDDYISLGWFKALEVVNMIVPKQKVHATGYCIGGTLLSIAAASMARDKDDRLASLTLFAAQTDFSESGELGLFIDEAQVALLEAQMDKKGYLRADQMAGAFQMLRSYDLLWSRLTKEYLLGERSSMIDLMAWNADATRMPAKMHSQYLRRLYLNNEFSAGRYPVNGRSVSMANVHYPIFCVGTKTDHVAPWLSVYKIHYLTSAEITFTLTTGGHNAGIISGPSHPRRQYQLMTRKQNGTYIPPQEWIEKAESHQGSWWPAWIEWLDSKSSKTTINSPVLGTKNKNYPVLEDAPGLYVLD